MERGWNYDASETRQRRHVPTEFRQISLLNSSGNLFEEISLKRTNFQLREMKVIRNDQYGFKRGHSATHALLRNAERITHGFNNNKATVTFVLDIEQAFDKFWTTGLIAIFITAKISPHLIHIIHNYLQKSILSVVHKNLYWILRPIQAEYLRVALLGPTLLHIYVKTLHQSEMTLRPMLMTRSGSTKWHLRS
jgi:hypothetical protein